MGFSDKNLQIPRTIDHFTQKHIMHFEVRSSFFDPDRRQLQETFNVLGGYYVDLQCLKPSKIQGQEQEDVLVGFYILIRFNINFSEPKMKMHMKYPFLILFCHVLEDISNWW